jgi:ABC-2 type transport system permease protein
MAAQITLATLAICLAAWAWVGALSLLPAAEGLAVLRAAPAQFALAQVAALVYTAAPLALGFFFGQLGVGLGALNGFGNIVSLAFAFLGGAFTIGLEPTGAMAAIGQFTPAHWHVKAVDQAFAWSHGSWVGVGPYLGALGVELLFAAAVAAVGLVIGRLRASRRGGGAGESPASVAAPAEQGEVAIR